ncbi:MAG: endonuclease MutS2 [Firmicutes bacterium]|nr:endonuclease MutS2 [Bacillota bacterium]
MINTINTLEFDIILDRVAAYAVSTPAKAEVLQLLPCADIAEAKLLLDVTDEMRLLSQRHSFFVPTFEDITDSVARAKIGGSLIPKNLSNIAAILRTARLFGLAVSKEEQENIPNLTIWADALEPTDDLERAISRAIEGDSVRDDASEPLRTIRRRIIAQDNKLKQKLSSYSKSGEHSKYLQDNIVTVRNGRYVLPVKAEFRPNVQGLVHDKSAGGATVFVEPFAVVELNNELKALYSEELAEVERILKELSALVAQKSAQVEIAFEYMVRADITLAKFLYSKSISAVKPLISDAKTIEIKEGRHPLIDPQKIVPIDLELGDTKHIMLLSGPNTGGKTVTLKTVGLFCFMSAVGIFVPCKSAKLPIFKNIYCDIGDGQSIAESLSTFSSRLVRLKEITDNMNNKSIILLDELGAGTDPNEGTALAIGIIERIKEAGAMAIITTHFGDLKKYSAGDPKIIGASMQFDDVTLRPAYKLIMGIPGVSNAIRIADNLGLDKRITLVANKHLKSGYVYFENALREAQKLKGQALKELEVAEVHKLEAEKARTAVEYERDKLTKQREGFSKQAKNEVDKLVEKSKAKADSIISQLKECLKQGDESAYFEARKLAVQLEQIATVKEQKRIDLKPLTMSQIKQGMAVTVISLGCDGIVKSINQNKKLVQVVSGIMTLNVKAEDLAENKTSPKRAEKTVAKVYKQERVADEEKQITVREINIIGQTVDEGIRLVDIFLADCILDGTKNIRIIHGKGTGALGRGIQSHLKSLPHISTYDYGGHYDGGTGATVVELK